MPRLEEYYNMRADDVHPFDRIADEANESARKEMQVEDDYYDRSLHERELLGRLMGQKLTPRQFEVLAGQYSDETSKWRYI